MLIGAGYILSTSWRRASVELASARKAFPLEPPNISLPVHSLLADTCCPRLAPACGSQFPVSIMSYRRFLCLGLTVAFCLSTAAHADSTYTLLHDFRDHFGSPQQLTRGHDGNLYGVTTYGEAGWGSVFKIDSSNAVTRLHEFSNIDGANPLGALVQGSDGTLYGTASSGGAFGAGTVFKIDTVGTFRSLHSFNVTDGASPRAGLVEGRDGAFYGTTTDGGTFDHGTIFKIDGAGTFTSLHSLNSTEDGAHPYAALVQGDDGAFYGTTFNGGRAGQGTVFRVDNDETFTLLHNFGAANDGALLTAGVVEASDGAVYGTTIYGGTFGPPNGYGTVFKIDSTGTFTTLHSFGRSGDGVQPAAGVIADKAGNLYGTTDEGARAIFSAQRVAAAPATAQGKGWAAASSSRSKNNLSPD